MAIKLGIKTEFAMADESTYGTESVATKQYFDAVSESVVLDNPNITSNRLRGGRLPTASALVKGGRKRVSGNVDVEVQAQSVGWMLKHLMGGFAVTGVGPYEHTFTLDDLPTSFTLWIKRDDETFAYVGSRINTAEFSIDTDGMLRMTMGVLGRDGETGATFGTSTYPADNDFYAFHEATVSIDAAEIDAREVTINFDNQLTEMPKLGDRLNRQPVDGRAVITGTIRKEFEDLDAYTKFVNGEVASLNVAFVGVDATGTPTGRDLSFNFDAIFYTGGTPNVGAPEPIPQELPFEVRDDGTANGGITVVLDNNTASYA